MAELALTTRPESPDDAVQIERLHDRAFGPGRYARTAYRLREGRPHRPDLSFTTLVGTLLVGSVRLSAVRSGSINAVMLGPLAVEPAFEGRGIAGALIREALDACRAAGEELVMLVGDPPYYNRFGFQVAPPGSLVLPGPVDPARILYVELAAGAFERAKGAVSPL
ncbi:GNAT family N-acetyltransferase [Camelimonas lactis]|uniref:Putative N-acetyltransferase YhbS n=1 Tax=Camelimonas lactis TaxID=659006 RepID=A0A4V2RXD6_9HYPH|nr:N-acetyltransferase [Camelimonas lactis]TCO13430.1 putative N-acetyltransferase YhbS [Camelimonas lactis]